MNVGVRPVFAQCGVFLTLLLVAWQVVKTYCMNDQRAHFIGTLIWFTVMLGVYAAGLCCTQPSDRVRVKTITVLLERRKVG